MADPGAAFYAAEADALRGSVALAALFPGGAVRVYSAVPQNAPLPFIKIGDDQILENSDECVSASEIYATVHVLTKPDAPGQHLGRQIAGAVRATLAPRLSVPGFDVVLAEFVNTRLITDPDGTAHAVLTFHFFLTTLEPETP